MNHKTKINWYDLKDKVYLYLEENTYQDLVRRGIEKAGSLSKLCVVLKTTHFYSNLRKNNTGISINMLRRLLIYLDIDFDAINNKITEIRKGNRCSIKNPKFPINLLNIEIGSILGHIVSDGCLYYDKSRRNLIRTKYCSGDTQAIEMFIADMAEVFGEVHFNEEFARNCTMIKIGNSIIGESLKIAGAPVGRKCKLNNGLPWIIRIGSKEMKRKYLSAVFDDEGCIGENRAPYIILSRNFYINFNEKEKSILEAIIVPEMKSSTFPTGHITRRISIGKLRQILSDSADFEILNKLSSFEPNVINEESNLLKEEFKIHNYLYITSLQLTQNGKYSIQFTLVIRNKTDVLNFYENIGFCLDRKQNKLEQALINKGWLNYAT